MTEFYSKFNRNLKQFLLFIQKIRWKICRIEK